MKDFLKWAYANNPRLVCVVGFYTLLSAFVLAGSFVYGMAPVLFFIAFVFNGAFLGMIVHSMHTKYLVSKIYMNATLGVFDPTLNNGYGGLAPGGRQFWNPKTDEWEDVIPIEMEKE